MTHLVVIGLRGIPDVMGGIETHCAHLLPRMAAAAPAGQLKLTVLARARYARSFSGQGGIDQVALWAPRHRLLETIVHSALAVLHARFRLGADCVHLHAIGPGLTAPLARLLGLPVLFTHHGEDYRRQKWGRLSRLALRLGEALAVRLSQRVITVSRSTRDRLQRRHPRKAAAITYIPNGLPPPGEPGDADLGALGVEPGQFIVTVGRLVPEKAQDILIDAYRMTGLADRQPRCKLLLLGDADHDSAYSRQILRRADANVLLAGRQPREMVMAANRGAALFVLPSHHEGLSVAALEAIRAGTPILLSDIRANLDLGLPARHYFRAGSAEDLARKLEADPASYAVPDDFDVSAFDWNVIAAQTLAQLAAIRRAGVPLFSEPPSGRAGHARS